MTTWPEDELDKIAETDRPRRDGQGYAARLSGFRRYGTGMKA
jgi:hypothetical protein